MPGKTLVLDANIIIRAVLGEKVRHLLVKYSNIVEFFTPDVCMQDANKYLPLLFKKRGMSAELPLRILVSLQSLIVTVDKCIYQDRIDEAQQRMKNRDIFDWPVVATALLFGCPIWTEDQDFFGSGISIWTTDRIHLFFQEDTEDTKVTSC